MAQTLRGTKILPHLSPSLKPEQTTQKLGHRRQDPQIVRPRPPAPAGARQPRALLLDPVSPQPGPARKRREGRRGRPPPPPPGRRDAPPTRRLRARPDREQAPSVAERGRGPHRVSLAPRLLDVGSDSAAPLRKRGGQLASAPPGPAAAPPPPRRFPGKEQTLSQDFSPQPPLLPSRGRTPGPSHASRHAPRPMGSGIGRGGPEPRAASPVRARGAGRARAVTPG